MVIVLYRGSLKGEGEGDLCFAVLDLVFKRVVTGLVQGVKKLVILLTCPFLGVSLIY